MGFVDAAIMAYAERHDLPILTFDFEDFEQPLLRMVGVWSSTRRDTERLWIKDLISAVRAPIDQLPFIHVCNFPFIDLAFREWSARKAGATTTPGSRSVSSSPTDIPDSLETEFRSASFSADQKGVV